MLYSTIVTRDETGLNQIYEAAKEMEELNVLEAILECNFDIRKVEQTLNLVRMYQARLNIESMELVAFSEKFIEEYATDNNKCFHIALRLVRKIGTTITGSMKIFRKYCPVVRKRLEGSNNIVPVLDYSRLTFRQYHSQFFGAEPYCELVKTLLQEQTTFFYHLIAILKICKDMIRQEEEVRGNYTRLKKIFDDSCDKVLKSIKDINSTFGSVKLISDEELAERRKKARPLREWLAKDYHEHDKNWLRREGYILRCIAGERFGLDDEASQFFPHNPEHGALVCKVIDQLDSLGLSKKKTKVQGYEWQYDSMDLVFLLKWAKVSSLDKQGNVINEEKEKRFYEDYVMKHYKGNVKLPTWQAVCRQRAFCYNEFSLKEMQDAFAKHLPKEQESTAQEITIWQIPQQQVK
jgi:hypothetical protein